MREITKLSSVADIVEACPTARQVFDRYGLKGCGGGHGPTESLAFFAAVHNVDIDALVGELNTEMLNTAKQEYVYQESLGDFIYRRFFKAAIVIVLALIDGPLRDVQLLGFGALIIAGVSQRFVPQVYGLGKPRHDRQSLIFWLINGSLVLDVASYVLLFSTGNLYFSLGLELAFLLMAVWAVLLVMQIRVFAKTPETDRSLKFIRAAYAWLLFSMAMLPFFLVYGVATPQGFSHAYLGSYRHAYTVGFVSLMILGVASRVVPILAGVDSKRISSLWAPFVLINMGCGGRVVLQILTDFTPKVAFPLVGVTGFIEVTALAWWGMELWHTMNLYRTRRAQLLRAPLAVAAR